jgi:hypothetical protein
MEEQAQEPIQELPLQEFQPHFVIPVNKDLPEDLQQPDVMGRMYCALQELHDMTAENRAIFEKYNINYQVKPTQE